MKVVRVLLAMLLVGGWLAGPARQGVDRKAVESAIGRPGVTELGEVYRFNFARSDLRVTAAGVEIRPAFALGGWVAMKATAGEVNPVVRALRDNGIEVTSLHSHLIGEEPRLFFMHSWANDDALRLAGGLRAALDRTDSRPSAP